MEKSFHSIWDGHYVLPTTKKNEPAPVSSMAQSQEELDYVTTTGTRRAIFSEDVVNDVDGPLAALESTVSGASTLNYPNSLGADTNYAGRYAMRILIYKQEKAPVTDLGLVSAANSPFDRSRKAAQQGRVNYSSFGISDELIADESTKNIATALGVAGATGKGALNAVKAGSKELPLVGSIVQGIETGVVTATQLGAAYSSTENLRGNPNRFSTRPQAYIHLHMPETLNFVDRHDYDAVSVTDALGVQGLVAQGNVTELLGRIGERASLFGVNLLGQNFTELALFNSGIALNPQLELLYRKTNNREFIFNFRFVPSNREDAQAIEDIIRTLRYHSAPRFRTLGNTTVTNNSRYIIPPSQFEIEFITLDPSGVGFNDRLPRIGSCVLSNVDVNYAPSGQFSAFQGDYPVETQVQLTFTETVILTKQDIALGY
jgi:hypothetical protein